MATAKFVYIQWVGENVKPIHKAIVINHKYDLEDIFYVSFYNNVMIGSIHQ